MINKFKYTNIKLAKNNHKIKYVFTNQYNKYFIFVLETYLSVGDCVDGLKGQKLHDIC